MAEEWKGDDYKVVKPRPKGGLVSWVIDCVEKLVVRSMYDSSKPLHFLQGNFAPVEECDPKPYLPVDGHLPPCLNGEFVRVGPNPKFAPVAGYHWFDGDGMIHGLRIKDGKATYVSRYVKTSRLKQEEYFGRAKFLKIGDLQGIFGLLMAQIHSLRQKFGVLDMSYGGATGNTALIYHHGKLLALSEADKPYALRVLEDGDLQTLGLMDYDEKLTHSFTAHPKVDPITGEMFTFGYQHTPPYCTYRVVTNEGVMLDPVPITLAKPTMMHDFAITENYAIFLDLPLYFAPKDMVKGGKMIISYDTTVKARFGILPRYAKNDLQMRWFELPNCYIFHNANAWEEGDEVILYTCRLPDLDLEMVGGSAKEKMKNFENELYEMRFNLKTGEASQKKLSESAVDFPRINEKYVGRKQRYVYGTIIDSVTQVKGLVKFDLQGEPEVGKSQIEVGGNVLGCFDLGAGRFGSEAIFVPRDSDSNLEEDDGYLICFVHDENTRKSEVNVFDAKTMSPEPVAIVHLPTRVPYGFHAFFVSEEQLQNQA
uniref:carotenoid 9,10-dioxygenase n=1 Tax=Wollemia nobilis TaxID=56998 RepID=A0A0C9QLD5_9CONI